MDGQWTSHAQSSRNKSEADELSAAIGLVCLVAVTVAVSRFKPAAPELEPSSVWTDSILRHSVRSTPSLTSQLLEFLCLRGP
jgi:hypothetical protein